MSGVRVWEPPEGENAGFATPEIDTVQVIVDGETRHRQRVVLARRASRPQYGSVFNVAPGETRVVATLVGEPQLVVTGITATGSGDAIFRLTVNGNPVVAGRITWTTPNVSLALPAGVLVPVGSVARIVVQSVAKSVADFEGTINGEITHG